MNKILVIKDKLENYLSDDLIIENNTITFIKDGNYILEYEQTNNINITINIKDNLNINLFEYSNDNNLKMSIIYNLNKNSTLTLYKFYNNKEVEENVTINLEKEYSKIDYHFSNICSNKEIYHIIINHKHKNTISLINNKSISTNNANLSFTIDSILEKGYTNCILDQQTRIITLDNSYAKIEPNMYIEEDDVIAKHGSVIGNFSHNEIFYLMTRGLTKEEATKLLIKGLIFSNIKTDLENRAKILNIINEKWR